MKDFELKLISELMKNGRRSDKELASARMAAIAHHLSHKGKA
jgi:hypothetical protein